MVLGRTAELCRWPAIALSASRFRWTRKRSRPGQQFALNHGCWRRARWGYDRPPAELLSRWRYVGLAVHLPQAAHGQAAALVACRYAAPSFIPRGDGASTGRERRSMQINRAADDLQNEKVLAGFSAILLSALW